MNNHYNKKFDVTLKNKKWFLLIFNDIRDKYWDISITKSLNDVWNPTIVKFNDF